MGAAQRFVGKPASAGNLAALAAAMTRAYNRSSVALFTLVIPEQDLSDGIVTGVARPFHIGARSQVWSIEIRDARERLVCVSRLTMAVVEWRPASEEKTSWK